MSRAGHSRPWSGRATPSSVGCLARGQWGRRPGVLQPSRGWGSGLTWWMRLPPLVQSKSTECYLCVLIAKFIPPHPGIHPYWLTDEMHSVNNLSVNVLLFAVGQLPTFVVSCRTLAELWWGVVLLCIFRLLDLDVDISEWQGSLNEQVLPHLVRCTVREAMEELTRTLKNSLNSIRVDANVEVCVYLFLVYGAEGQLIWCMFLV